MRKKKKKRRWRRFEKLMTKAEIAKTNQMLGESEKSQESIVREANTIFG